MSISVSDAPSALTRAGLNRLTAAITTASRNHQGACSAQHRLDAAQASPGLYDDHPAVDFTSLAAEITTEVRLLRVIQAELTAHAACRETYYRKVGPPGPPGRCPVWPRPTARAGRVHG